MTYIIPMKTIIDAKRQYSLQIKNEIKKNSKGKYKKQATNLNSPDIMSPSKAFDDFAYNNRDNLSIT